MLGPYIIDGKLTQSSSLNSYIYTINGFYCDYFIYIDYISQIPISTELETISTRAGNIGTPTVIFTITMPNIMAYYNAMDKIDYSWEWNSNSNIVTFSYTFGGPFMVGQRIMAFIPVNLGNGIQSALNLI